jgi:hypothetical protein
MVAFKSNRDAPRLLLQHRMNRRLDGRNHHFIRRLDSNQSEPPQVWCLQHRMIRRGVGVLSRFQGSTTILARISDRMTQRSAGGTIGSSDGTTFSGDFFQRLASNARPINKPPCLSRAALCHSEDPLQPRREGECVLANWDSLPLD